MRNISSFFILLFLQFLLEEKEIMEKVKAINHRLTELTKDSADYCKRMFYVLQCLKPLDPHYAIAFSILVEASANAVKRIKSSEVSAEELCRCITDATKDALHLRVKNRHRIPVGLVISILSQTSKDFDFKLFINALLLNSEESSDKWTLPELDSSSKSKEDEKDSNLEELLNEIEFKDNDGTYEGPEDWIKSLENCPPEVS